MSKDKKNKKDKIDVNRMKYSIGHQERESGCGRHSDKREKRKRTRQSKKRSWLDDQLPET